MKGLEALVCCFEKLAHWKIQGSCLYYYIYTPVYTLVYKIVRCKIIIIIQVKVKSWFITIVKCRIFQVNELGGWIIFFYIIIQSCWLFCFTIKHHSHSDRFSHFTACRLTSTWYTFTNFVFFQFFCGQKVSKKGKHGQSLFMIKNII